MDKKLTKTAIPEGLEVDKVQNSEIILKERTSQDI